MYSLLRAIRLEDSWKRFFKLLKIKPAEVLLDKASGHRKAMILLNISLFMSKKRGLDIFRFF